MSNYDDYEDNSIENTLKAMALGFTLDFILFITITVFFYTHPLITDDVINYMITISHSIKLFNSSFNFFYFNKCYFS